MATKTWYATNNLVSVHQEMSETDPGTEAFASPATGWVVGTTGSGTGAFNSQVESSTFSGTNPDGSIDTSTGDCLRTTNTYTGSFAAGNWTVNFCVRSQTAVAANGRMLCRLFRGANADGTAATEINTGTKTGSTVTLSTSTTLNSTVTFNPGSFSVTNEYIFIQLAWERLSAASMSTSDVNMRVGNSASLGTRVVSADFTLPPELLVISTSTAIAFSRSIRYFAIQEPPLGQALAALSGPTTLTFSPAAILLANAPLSGSTSLTFSPAAILSVPAPVVYAGVHAAVLFRKTIVYPAFFEPVVAEAPVAVLSGTTSLTFAPTAALAATATLQATTTLTFSPSATIAALAAMQGATSLTFSPAAVLSGAALLSGTTSLTFSPAAILRASAVIQGATTLTFSPTAILRGSAAISGATTLTFSPAAILRASAGLSGSTTLTFSPSGNLIAGVPGELSGSTSLTFTPSASLGVAGIYILGGSTSLTFSPSGALIARSALSGASTTVFTIAGSLNIAGIVQISGTSSLTFIVSANLTIPIVEDAALSGETRSYFIISGNVRRTQLYPSYYPGQFPTAPGGYESEIGVWHVHEMPKGSKSRFRARTGKRYRIYSPITVPIPDPEPPPLGPLWILEGGLWHDDGIWIDTRFWED